MARRRQTNDWYSKHTKDEYVRAASARGARSRAQFKLEQINKRDRVIRPGQRIVDLGAAPGGWSQYAAAQLKGRGRVVAVDRLAIEPLTGVHVLQMDLMDETLVDAVLAHLDGEPADLVLSDAAPNVSGIRDADTAASLELSNRILELARELLRPGGSLLLKLFEGAGVQEFEQAMKASFTECKRRKPQASRSRSREIYLLARNFRMV